LEAMACGTPVVAADEPALREVGGDAAVYADDAGLAAAVRRTLAEREARSRAGIERARLFSWEETARRVVGGYRPALAQARASAVVISHGDAEELSTSLPALAAQVDEVVVIGNVAGSVGDVPHGVRVIRNAEPQGFAANANRGIAETSCRFVVLSNPDAVPEP